MSGHTGTFYDDEVDDDYEDTSFRASAAMLVLDMLDDGDTAPCGSGVSYYEAILAAEADGGGRAFADFS